MQYNSYTEWDPLRSMMVADIDTDNTAIASDIFKLQGKHLSTLVEKTKKMLDTLSDTLSDRGVEIIRPNPKNFTGKHRFPCLNIRDRLGVVGKKLLQYSHGEDYASLPACYDVPVNFTFPRFSNHMIWNGEQMMNDVPYLEGANLIRCGNIIFCTIEDTGNELGIDVLQNVIGNEYTIVPITKVKNHLDAHVNFINDKLMLYDARMDISEIRPHIPNVKTVPIVYEKSKETDIVWPDIQDDDIENTNLLMSNTISIDPETVICLNAKYNDMEFFHTNGIHCISIDWPEQWLVNAGLHCFTVDLIRDGKLRNPFDKT